MLKQFLFLICLSFMALSCNVGAPKKPKNLISKSKMVNILIDAKLIGSATYINRNIMQDNGIVLDKYVFEKHGIDSLQFALSNNYYAYYSKEYEAIYNKVIDSLEALKVVIKEQELKEKREAEKKVRDSLENITKTKDSLKQIKTKDSLKLVRKKDSMAKKLKPTNTFKEEGVLISPVSDKTSQSRK